MNLQEQLQRELALCQQYKDYYIKAEKELLDQIKKEESIITVKHGDVCQAKYGLRIIVLDKKSDKLQSLSSDGTIQIENIEQGQDVLCHQEYVVLYNVFTSKSCGRIQN